MLRLKHVFRWLVLLCLSVAVFVLLTDWKYPLDFSPVDSVSPILTGEGGHWLYVRTNKGEKWRFRVDSSRVDPLYLKMLIQFEDSRFAEHFGVDPLAILRAAGAGVIRGHIVSGASTITMQLARLLEPKPRTLRSKIIEAIRAFQIEMHHDKRSILSAYLTLTPYGGNIEGVVAASRHYFGKNPENLSAAQAALLVALPKNPERYRPDRHPRQAQKARNRVLQMARAHNLVSEKMYQQALKEPLPRHAFNFPRLSPHLAEHLLASHVHENKSIATTLNVDLQRQLEAWAHIQGDRLSKGATMALLLVRNRDGAVLSYLGSHDMFSLRTSGYVDMIPVARSPGSTLKPFVYGMAFEKHLLHPNSILYDRPTRFGDYLPHNYTRKYTGEVTAAYALKHSLNIPAVSIIKRIGPGAFVARIGSVAGKLKIPKKEATLPVVLGGLGVSIWQLTQLYTDLANGGSGSKIHVRVSSEKESNSMLLRPEAAQKVTAILRSVSPPEGAIDPQKQIAFKTGTSYGYRDLWTAAYTHDLTLVLWLGRPDNAPLPKQSGLQTAAPLAFDALGIARMLLPGHGWGWSPDYLGKQAPVGLRYFDHETHAKRTPLTFIQPAQNSRFRSAGCHDVVVIFQIADGIPPYYGYLDGESVLLPKGRIEPRLGRGAHTLTVIDSRGATETRDIWVDQPECETEKQSRK